MGRYLTGAAASGGGSARSETHRISSTVGALAIPPWAKFARITGSGAGAGGGNYVGEITNWRGGGGGAGGVARGALLLIDAEPTMAVTIGAAGIGAAGSSGANGGNGGDTVIAVGSKSITLGGGKGGPSEAAVGGAGGGAKFAAPGDAFDNYQPAFDALDAINRGFLVGLSSGSMGASYNNGCGGAESMFGRGGRALGAPATNEPGENAQSFGAGGAGSRGSGKAGDGRPAMVIVEFVEAA